VFQVQHLDLARCSGFLDFDPKLGRQFVDGVEFLFFAWLRVDESEVFQLRCANYLGSSGLDRQKKLPEPAPNAALAGLTTTGRAGFLILL
jgi:hypothetical protein